MEISGSLEYCISVVWFPEDIRYVNRGMRGRVPQVKHKSDGFLAWFVSYYGRFSSYKLDSQYEVISN